jgi:hypothetical protein
MIRAKRGARREAARAMTANVLRVMLLVLVACGGGSDEATEKKSVAETKPTPEAKPAAVKPVAKPAGSAVSPEKPVVKTEPNGVEEGSGAMFTGISSGAANAPPIRIGDRVFGMWTNGRWYPGKIGKVNGDGTYDVYYDDGDVSRALPTSKIKVVPKLTTPVGDGTYRVNDAVYGMWTNGQYYPGKIAAINPDGSYRVHYNDGDVSPSLPAAKIKPRTVGSAPATGCAGGQTKCGGTCVDLLNDPKNCNACGRTCPEACMGGSCVSNAYKHGN